MIVWILLSMEVYFEVSGFFFDCKINMRNHKMQVFKL